MKKNIKKRSKQEETTVSDKEREVSLPVKADYVERARQRAEASRQAAVNKVVTQSPD